MDYCRRKVLFVKDKLEQLSQLVSAECVGKLVRQNVGPALRLAARVRSGANPGCVVHPSLPLNHRTSAAQPSHTSALTPALLQVKQRQAMLAQVDALLDQRMGEQQAAGQQAAAGPAAAGQKK